ncbi:HD domain-containing phosphohydrolase [Desulfocurvus sp. DL9XJH121]
MPPIILFVDRDDSHVKSLPGKFVSKFDLRHVDSYEAAIDVLARRKDVAVVISDLDVGGGDGIVFLANARLSSPDTVRMVFTARNKFTDALNSLNTARAFLFIKKPCPPVELARFLFRGVQFHTESIKEQRAVRKSLVGSVKALVDILHLVNPGAMQLSRRIWKRVMEVGKALGVKPLWRLELAVTLSHLGCVGMPVDLLEKMEKGLTLTLEEQQVFGMHPHVAANLLANIDQMEPVAEIVRQQRMPLHESQPVEARIIHVALDQAQMEAEGASPEEIQAMLRERAGTYDPEVLRVMLDMVKPETPASQLGLKVAELHAGMVMAVDLVNKDGTVLLPRGMTLSKPSLMRLQAFPEELGLVEPVLVEAESAQE